MSRFSLEERDEILRTQRELLTDAERAGFGEDAIEADAEFRGSPDWLEQMLPPSDPLERWRREQAQLEAERAAFRQREADNTDARRIRDWNAWLRAGIAAYLQENPFNDLQHDVLGCVISEERQRERQERKTELDKVRSEFATALGAALAKGDETVRQLRAELAVAKGFSDGTIIDITAEPVVRKVKDNNAA